MANLNQNEKTIWSCWETKTPREVVREAAAKGSYINLAYQYLQFKHSWDEQTARQWFTTEVYSWVLQLLSRKQFFKASHVLNKIGVAPSQHLLTIAFESTDPTLRDYITEQLIKTADDLQTESSVEWKAYLNDWSLLKILEKSFDLNGVPKQNKVYGSGKDIIIITLSEMRQLTVKKIESFPVEWKKNVSAHLFVDTLDFSLESFLDQNYIWKILLHRNMALVLRRWISLVFSKDKNMLPDCLINDRKLLRVDCNPLDSDSILKKFDELLVTWPISDEMIDTVSSCGCFEITKIYIYDSLCSFGKIQEDEIDNIQLIMRRLIRSHSLSHIDKITVKNDRSFLNNMIAQYCVRHNLYHAMIKVVNESQLKFDLQHCLENGVENLLDLWLLLKHVNNSKTTSNYVYAIYETSRILAKDNMDEYLTNNHILILAMFIFNDQDLFEIFNENRTAVVKNYHLSWTKDFSVVLPHLYSVYRRWKDNSLIVKNDVTIYQLLSGYRGLDITKVLSHQLSEVSKNKYQNFNADDTALAEAPHFSNKQLVQRYGFRRKLTYSHYLKQNRPGTAAQCFIIEQYQTYGTINIVSLTNACTEAHLYALQNWKNSIITASCVAFITMIGCDSTRCRNHLTIAKLIRDHIERDTSDADATVEKYISRLVKRDDDVVMEILDIAVQCVEATLKIKKAHSTIDFGQVLDEWQTVIKFAYFHNVPLPLRPLERYVLDNDWVSFLMFADVFMYPLDSVLKLCKKFESGVLIDHITQSLLHMNEDINMNNHKKHSFSNENESDDKCTPNFSFISDDLWEILTNCHGPDDPPGALIRASAYYHSPILALIATYYEPEAVDVSWAQWLLSSMRRDEALNLLSEEERDASDMVLSDFQVQKIMKYTLECGYYRTLEESLTIFYSESPLCHLLSFLVRTTFNLQFDTKSVNLLNTLKTIFEKRTSISCMERSRFMKMSFVQSTTIELIMFTLCNGFQSVWHQFEFLKCVCTSEVMNHISGPCPDFQKLMTFLNISIRCKILIDMKAVTGSDGIKARGEFLKLLITNKFFDDALEFASAANLRKDDLLLAEWSEKHDQLTNDASGSLNSIALLQFWAKCSSTLLKFDMDVLKATDFLMHHCEKIDDQNVKFYMLRLIFGWFGPCKDEIMIKRQENIEFEMWKTYLSSINCDSLQVSNVDDTYEYIQSLKVDGKTFFQEITVTNTKKQLFNKSLDEIIEESKINCMSIVGHSLDVDKYDKWNNCIMKLLDEGLIMEAWRLNTMFSISSNTPHNTIRIVETCLRLAEESMNPHEVPADLKTFIVLSPSRTRLTESHLSDSFEELVLIPNKQEEIGEDVVSLAGKKDADVLSLLDAFSLSSGIKFIKIVANYFRIALQIGWTYEKVLKYDGNPLNLINYLTGRGRMPLAKMIFNTYDLPSQKVMEYLSLEMVTAIVSSHLTRTSGFRQKEHFRYTLWGYLLDSDFEMFLNMRPDGNSLLGKLILEYLSAFRKLYKSNTVPVATDSDGSPNSNFANEVEDEYHDIDQEELEDASECSESTVGSILPIFKMFSKTLDNQSVVSSSTASQNLMQRNKRDKKPQLDVISCTSIRISPLVKMNMKSLIKNSKLSTKQINVISIELLVLAHECFSSVCDTEGIATILRSAQTLTSHLFTARSWRLMVRLLTGISRYTEMTYIFQILKDNDQFEFLLGQFHYMLGQREDKINNFKIGLLEFLKRHYPGDTEHYCLVAFHFFMFAEAAEVKKKQAENLIVAVKQMADMEVLKVAGGGKSKKKNTVQREWTILAENDSTRVMLDTALSHASEAAELYSKAGCLGASREMAAYAQVIALQISLLRKPPTKCLFDLPRDKMSTIIGAHLSFMEGLIYSQAVSVKHGDWMSQWHDIVYQRVLKKDGDFIKEIMSYRPDLAFYIIERYDQTKNTSLPDEQPIVELRSIFKFN